MKCVLQEEPLATNILFYLKSTSSYALKIKEVRSIMATTDEFEKPYLKFL